MRRFCKILVFLIVSLLALEAALNIAFRFLRKNHGRSGWGYFISDKELGWRHNENYRGDLYYGVEITTGEYGNRNDKKNEGAGKNVFLLGDSQISFSTRNAELCSELLNEKQKEYFFVNMGQEAYSPAHQYLLLKKYGIPPGSRILLIVFTGNDLYELVNGNPKYPEVKPEGGGFSLQLPSKATFSPLWNRSAVLSTIMPLGLRTITAGRHVFEDRQGLETANVFSAQPELEEEALSRLGYVLDLLKGEYDVQCIVLGNFFSQNGEHDLFKRMMEGIAKELNLRNIRFIEFLPGRELFDKTFHLNAEGHKALAERIGSFMNITAENTEKDQRER